MKREKARTVFSIALHPDLKFRLDSLAREIHASRNALVSILLWEALAERGRKKLLDKKQPLC